VVNDSKILEDINQIQAKKELEQLETKIITEATYKKEVTINDNDTGLSVTFAAHTNIPELLNYYTESNLKLKLGEVLSEETSDRKSTETDDSQEFVPIDTDRNIIKLKLLNISSLTENVDDIPTFSFKLEDNLRQALRDYKAYIVIDLENMSMSRACGNISSVKMTSDGKFWDFTKAHARVYYKKNNCNFLQCRPGSFYSCLTSKVTNTGVACNAAYISSVVHWGDVVWITWFGGCNASC